MRANGRDNDKRGVAINAHPPPDDVCREIEGWHLAGAFDSALRASLRMTEGELRFAQDDKREAFPRS